MSEDDTAIPDPAGRREPDTSREAAPNGSNARGGTTGSKGGGKAHAGRGQSRSPSREDRLASALRANLRRRKAAPRQEAPSDRPSLLDED